MHPFPDLNVSCAIEPESLVRNSEYKSFTKLSKIIALPVRIFLTSPKTRELSKIKQNFSLSRLTNGQRCTKFCVCGEYLSDTCSCYSKSILLIRTIDTAIQQKPGSMQIEDAQNANANLINKQYIPKSARTKIGYCNRLR